MTDPQRRRPPFPLVSGAALLLLAAMVIAVVVWRGHSGSAQAGHPPVTTPASHFGGRRGYADLIAILPADVGKDCAQGPPPAGSTADAHCGTSEFVFWNSEADMANELGLSGAPRDVCTSAPTGTLRRQATLPRGVRPGSVVCYLINSSQPAADRFYCVEWGVDERLLTGSFVAPVGGGPASYKPTYERAMTVLTEIV
jgi:hypothetical protein